MILVKDLIKIARFSSWWYYKIPLFIVVLFITQIGDAEIVKLNFKSILEALFLMVVGATFVSVLNDFTDREVDLIANKKNNFSNYSTQQSAVIMTLVFVISLVIPWLLKLNFNAYLNYYLAIFSYVLYSVKPLRLKDRGFWGMILDSLGSVVFPMGCFLYTASPNWSLRFSESSQVALFLWLFFLAMRSILVHQVEDKCNDIQSGTNTFVTRFSERIVNVAGQLMFFFEFSSFLCLCYLIELHINEIFLLFFLFYLGMQWLFKRIIWMKFSLFGKTNESSIVFMYDYYYSYLLISLVILLNFPWSWKIILLGALVVLFPVYFKQQFNCLKTLVLRLTIYRHKEPMDPV